MVSCGARRRARSTASAGDLVKADIAERAARLRSAGELDDIADQRGQLVELLDHVGAQRRAILAGEQRLVAQQLQVRAKRGDRRAQLVRRVGDEVALGVDRALERVERAC